MGALRERFALRCAERRGQLAAALDYGDLASVVRIAHELAGNAGIFGYPDLSRVARDLEAAARDPHRDDGELRGHGQQVLQALDRQRRNAPE